MNNYWCAAILHFELHYVVYTKKYLNIVINIANRLLENDGYNLNQKKDELSKITLVKKLSEDLLDKVII